MLTCVKLLRYLTSSLKLLVCVFFLCPFYTITVNKCTYLKNDLLCVITLYCLLLHVHFTHTVTCKLVEVTVALLQREQLVDRNETMKKNVVVFACWFFGCRGSTFTLTLRNCGWSFLHKLFALPTHTLKQLNMIWLVYCVIELVVFVCLCYFTSCWLNSFVGVLLAVFFFLLFFYLLLCECII